jgi:hypothetical protein
MAVSVRQTEAAPQPVSNLLSKSWYGCYVLALRQDLDATEKLA